MPEGGSRLNPDARAFSPGSGDSTAAATAAGSAGGQQRRQQQQQQQRSALPPSMHAYTGAHPYQQQMMGSSYAGGGYGGGVGGGYGGYGGQQYGSMNQMAYQQALAQQQALAHYQRSGRPYGVPPGAYGQQQQQQQQRRPKPHYSSSPPAPQKPSPGRGQADGAVDPDLNPSARPFRPASHQAATGSKKPVMLFLGAPGAGVTDLCVKLAKEMGGVAYSSTEVRKRAQDERERKFDNRPVTHATWVEVQDTLSGLRELLEKTAEDDEVKGYFLDITCRNNAIFHFISELLKHFGLAPGSVVHIETNEKSRLVEALTAAGESEAAAKKHIDHYHVCLRERLSMFEGVKGLVTTVSGDREKSALEADVKAASSLLFQNVLSFSIPYPSPSSGLTPILGIDEYVHVLNTLSDKVSGGDVRFPGTKETGQLVMRDGKLINTKLDTKVKPLGSTHVASKKTDGVRYLLVYTHIPGNENRGRLYLVPKSMEMVFVFSPRIGDLILEQGNAPLYGESGSLTTWVLDGELVATKSGWGGLQGMGCKQLMYIASDVLYFAAERPRDRFVNAAHWTLERRLEVLSRLNWPNEEQAPHDTTNVSLCTKTYYPLHNLPSLVAAVTEEAASYSTVGVLLTPRRRYIPYSDAELVSWTQFKYKRIHLSVKEKQVAPGLPAAYEVLAKKTWAGDDVVRVGEVVSKEVFSGNVVCRAEWEKDPGGPYKWVICGQANDCWEERAVTTYLEPHHWVPVEDLLRELYTEAPKEPERKVRVEAASGDAEEDEEDEDDETSEQRTGRGGGGRGR